MTTPLVQPTIADKGPWKVAEEGKALHSDDFTVDARLVIDGDFIDDYHRKDYAAWLAGALNATRPAPLGGGVDAWLPIDSAPHDRSILLRDSDNAMVSAKWYGVESWATDEDMCRYFFSPTHWMDKPAMTTDRRMDGGG
jgi:hypothetical protein